jgi:hypothetical protein
MITRENYEEFFLSYVDDELPVTLRAAVERFISDNPDLAPELEALQQCRVAPDQDAGFRDKEILFQYESSLLTYVDGELDEPGRVSLEEWVQRHPGAARELGRLQMTVSQPDLSIVFPDKQDLYRGGRRRAVMLPWLRTGVAAAVLGSVALLLFLRRDSGRTGDRQPAGIAAVAPKKNPGSVTSAAPRPLYSAVKDDRKIEIIQVKTRQPREVVKQTDRKPDATMTESVGVVVPVRSEVAVVDPQAVKKQAITVEPDKFTMAVAGVNIPKEESSFATQDLRRREQEDSTDNGIADASATLAKNKLRGLFRKVGRAFGTTAERDGEGQRQILISTFQVALK